MLESKIALTKELKEYITNTRNKYNFKLIDLVEKSKTTPYPHEAAWFSQIEGNRTQSIKREEIINIFRMILDVSEEEAEKYIESFLNTTINSESNENSNMRLYKTDIDKDETKFFNEALQSTLDMLCTHMSHFYNHLDNKYQAINMLSDIVTNFGIDIGFMVSLNSLKWDRLESVDFNTKQMIIYEINSIIKKHSSFSSLDQALKDSIPGYNPETDRPDYNTKIIK